MNKNKLVKILNKYGIDIVGVAPIEQDNKLKEILIERNEKNYITGMEESDIEKRTNPKLIMEDGKSIIVCIFPYFIGDKNQSNISKYCYGKDYHIVVNEILNKVCEDIKDEIDWFEYKVFSDNGPLVDRHLAYQAGLGYYGINNNIITDKYGSYVFIGYIVNNYDFEVDKPLEKSCLGCNKCVEYCPGNALKGNFEMDPRKCVSFMTQKKEEVSESEKYKIKYNKMVFGCDICQDVCPHNKNVQTTNLKDFYENIITNLDIEEIDEISNKEFKRRYKDRAFSWRGRKVIKRNLDIINEKSVK